MSQRPHILFVDDEPRILGGLRRMLRTHRDRWDMSFAEGGEAALAALRGRPCDVIVSDYRMPGMDGAELLEQVRTRYPGTARVILSGQTNEQNLLSIMVLAHEFLTKPSSPEQLVATVERLIDVRADPADDRPRPDRADVQSLPSPPHTLVELVTALDSDDASAQSVGTVIEGDPAATAKVLQLVNSSAYTVGRKVSNVGQAVALLGLHTVRGLVLMHDLIRTFDVTDDFPADWMDDLTRHSVETSRLCRMFAAGTEWESHAFTAGLLHEVGQLVLAATRPKEFGRAVESWRTPATEPLSLCAAESAVLDTCHIDAGAELLRFWGLPDPVIDAAACHAPAALPAVAVDASSAVMLAHVVVEADLGPVCGPHGAPMLDEDHLEERTGDVVSRWRRAQVRHQR